MSRFTADPSPPAAWRRLLLPLTCALMLVASLAWALWLGKDSDSWPGRRVTQARAWVAPAVDVTPPAAGAAWQPIELPDNWKVARPEGPAAVWYRVPLDTSGLQAPALLIARLATSGQVLLNGSRLWDGRESTPHEVRSWNAPVLVMLPPALLRPGGNELLIEVAGPPRYRAGLSHLQLGETAQLLPAYRARAFWQRDGAMLSSAISALAGLLMLFTWLRIRDEPMYLFFSAASLVWAARNSNLFLDSLPLTLDQWAAVVYLGHTWFNTLFGLFVLRFTQMRWRWVERALWLYAAVNTLALVSGMLGSIEQAMRWMAAPAVPLYLLLVGLLLRKGWRDRSTESALMAASVITYIVLSQRDGLLLNSKLPYDGFYISHYTGVLMLVSIVWSLVARQVSSLQAVERLNTELELRVADRTQALQAANAAKTRFLAAASHDIRQPVAAIGLMVGLLREQLASPALRGLVDRVDGAVASLETLLKGLLNLSRLDSGTVTPRMERVALQGLFDAIAMHEHETAQHKGLRLRLRTTPLAVRSDPVLLEQVLRNLVSNAVRYTERGGVLVSARRRSAHRVLLQVWDTGIGIPAEHQAAVFDEFVQLDNEARDQARGLGLGLAIVKRSVRLLGCTLRLSSQPGRGSCFSLELPIAEAQLDAATAPTQALQPLAGLNLWLVEDDAAVREALRLRLRHWGADVQAFDGAPTLKAALAQPGGPRIDLLLTDHRLPGANGLQVVAWVRERFGPVPALVVTGDTAPEQIALLADSGMPVLHKPFRAEQLLLALQSALQAARRPAPVGALNA
ncbi:ATP-binding protein [Ideonella sp. BN130291]|uniref:ATP-binding protein n=1 Tax=Ideonella sp. BN130291 TaxID=3112940 RepID=UPI002E25DB1E|nr:ATP-binding protein [Ideonella sp. BN130291]